MSDDGICTTATCNRPAQARGLCAECDGVCIGTCNDRYRRAWADYRAARSAYDPLDPGTSPPEMPAIRPMEGYPWCLECRGAILINLGQLDRLASLRALLADGYPSDASAERVSGSREEMSPSPQGDDVDDTARMLADWEWAYRRLRGMPSAERYGDLADQRTECVAWLAERLSAILDSDIGADFGTEVLRWHADLKAKTKAGVRTLRKPLRCPQCRMLLLKWTEGEKYVRCYNPDCGVMLPLEQYEGIVDGVAASIAKGGTAALLEDMQAGSLSGAMDGNPVAV